MNLAEDEIDADAAAYEREIAREPRVVKTPNPVIQKRGRNNRLRGHKAEREWFSLIERMCNDSHVALRFFPQKRGASGTDDGNWLECIFEVKSHLGRWCTKGERVKAWEQCRKQRTHRTPVLVECHRRQGRATEWQVWVSEDECVGGREWIHTQILGLL